MAWNNHIDHHKKRNCIDCGAIINHHALRCRKCNFIIHPPQYCKSDSEKILVPRNLCKDCGAIISRYSSRCRSCNIIRRNTTVIRTWLPRLNHYGYVEIHLPEHHRARTNGYVFEHIVVWEKAHGQTLPDGLVIHHINGIRNDNRPENLVAISSHEHGQKHRPKRSLANV